MPTDGKIPGASDLRAALTAAANNDGANAENTDENSAKTAEEQGTSQQEDAGGDEFTAEEREAMSQGWDPDYDGPNKRTAREFIDRGSFIKRISEQGKQLADMQKKLDFIMQREQEVKKAAAEEAIKALKLKKQTAIEDRDGAAVIEIDEKLDEAKQILAEVKETPSAAAATEEEIPTEFRAWIETHKWYEEDPEMRAVAEAIGRVYMDKHPNVKDPMKVLDHIEVSMKERYPRSHYFNNTARTRQGAVESSTRRRGSNRGGPEHSTSDLDSVEQEVMRNMIRVGKVKDEKTYIQSLEAVGYFKDR